MIFACLIFKDHFDFALSFTDFYFKWTTFGSIWKGNYLVVFEQCIANMDIQYHWWYKIIDSFTFLLEVTIKTERCIQKREKYSERRNIKAMQ